MTKLKDHPTVKRYNERMASNAVTTAIHKLSTVDLRKRCLECGADDMGIVEIDRPSFTGDEQVEATVVIKDKTINVQLGHVGVPDVRMHADAKAWLRLLHKDTSIIKQIVLRKIRIRGPLKSFKAFGRCFA